jgi:hypothetical protein
MWAFVAARVALLWRLRRQDGKTAYDLSWDYDPNDGGETLSYLAQFNDEKAKGRGR